MIATSATWRGKRLVLKGWAKGNGEGNIGRSVHFDGKTDPEPLARHQDTAVFVLDW